MRYILKLSLVFILFGLSAPIPAVADDAETLTELKAYWRESGRTIAEGDFAGYSALYHSDAVLVMDEVGKTIPMSKALANFKQGFVDTKAGKISASVGYKVIKTNIGKMTAHQTGIFYYFQVDNETMKRTDFYQHFEALFVKKDGKWLMLMDRQMGSADRGDYMGGN